MRIACIAVSLWLYVRHDLLVKSNLPEGSYRTRLEDLSENQISLVVAVMDAERDCQSRARFT